MSQKVAGSWDISAAQCDGCARALMGHVEIRLGESSEPVLMTLERAAEFAKTLGERVESLKGLR